MMTQTDLLETLKVLTELKKVYKQDNTTVGYNRKTVADCDIKIDDLVLSILNILL